MNDITSWISSSSHTHKINNIKRKTGGGDDVRRILKDKRRVKERIIYLFKGKRCEHGFKKMRGCKEKKGKVRKVGRKEHTS